MTVSGAPTHLEGEPILDKSERGSPVIETRQLTRRFEERIAVSALNLTVQHGEVYGFLGPNGAGKTTTLRMLLGLIKPTSGDATVLGAQPGTPDSLAKIGAMIEQPGFYPYLSGVDNLSLLATYAGAPQSRIPAALDQVGLSKRGRDRFSAYSQGMKQRLGLAAALLKDPALLILDEPSNGLDPAGMAEMRTLIKTLASEGRTVLLSSHLLAEVEQICDRVGVIWEGVLVAEGTTDELRGSEALQITATPIEKAVQYLADLPGVQIQDTDGTSIWVRTDRNKTADLTRGIVGHGLDLTELVWRRKSLEDVFLGLTNERTAA
jgi:ABC-type multidrug transport system ATPase subunit